MRVFQKMVTKKIFGPERVEITKESDKLHNFHSSLNSIMIIKLLGITWAGHVARMGEWESCRGIVEKKLK